MFSLLFLKPSIGFESCGSFGVDLFGKHAKLKCYFQQGLDLIDSLGWIFGDAFPPKSAQHCTTAWRGGHQPGGIPELWGGHWGGGWGAWRAFPTSVILWL